MLGYWTNLVFHHDSWEICCLSHDSWCKYLEPWSLTVAIHVVLRNRYMMSCSNFKFFYFICSVVVYVLVSFWCSHSRMLYILFSLILYSLSYLVDGYSNCSNFQAANYLDIKGLLDLTCQTVANMMKGKSVEEIRKIFNIKNDFTPEEEEEIRKENQWAFDWNRY